MKFLVNGFPKLGNKVELPNELELLHYPMFNRIDANDFRKYAAGFQKHMLDKAPLTGKYKYVYVDANIQALYPEVSSIGQRQGSYQENGWHIDGTRRMDEESNSIFHLLQNEATSNTVFNLEPFEIDIPDECDLNTFNTLINDPIYSSALVARALPAETFVSFDKHVHRAHTASRIEFRYFFRVTESNILEPYAAERARLNMSVAHVYHSIFEAAPVTSVERKNAGIQIHLPMYKRGADQ